MAKLAASDGADGDYFGSSVAIDGTDALVGAYWSDNNGLAESGAAYGFSLDQDGDGLFDYLEAVTGTDPYDLDTDDDGVADNEEDADRDGLVDAGETDPRSADTDGDGLLDGTELGLTASDITADTDPAVFQPDLDPSTTTSPFLADTDLDGFGDGTEDANQNGRVDPGESDPNNSASVPTIKGDLNGDKVLDLIDVVMALQVCCGMTPETEWAPEADVNNDGRIGLAEALYVLQEIAEMR